MAGLFDHPDVLNCSHRPKIFLGQSITKKKRQAVQAEVEKLSNIYIQNNFKLENMNKTEKELLFNNSNYNPHSFEHNVFCEDFNWGLASLQSSMENSIEDKCKETSIPDKFPRQTPPQNEMHYEWRRRPVRFLVGKKKTKNLVETTNATALQILHPKIGTLKNKIVYSVGPDVS